MNNSQIYSILANDPVFEQAAETLLGEYEAGTTESAKVVMVEALREWVIAECDTLMADLVSAAMAPRSRFDAIYEQKRSKFIREHALIGMDAEKVFYAE